MKDYSRDSFSLRCGPIGERGADGGEQKEELNLEGGVIGSIVSRQGMEDLVFGIGHNKLADLTIKREIGRDFLVGGRKSCLAHRALENLRKRSFVDSPDNGGGACDDEARREAQEDDDQQKFNKGESREG